MKKKHIHIIIMLMMVSFLPVSCKKSSGDAPKEQVQLLIFSKTKANRHESIEPGVKAMQSYFSKKGIQATHTEDTLVFTPSKLDAFDAVMFFNTSGNVLGESEEKAFQAYIRSGRGFVGVHAATDTEYDWYWYGQLTGAYFAGHPDIQSGVLVKTDTAHIATKHIPHRWTRTDEWYNFKKTPTNVQVLLKIDEVTYQGGTHGTDHPMSWCHTFEGGRSFYTALGHTVESYKDSMFLEHVLQGVLWATGRRE